MRWAVVDRAGFVVSTHRWRWRARCAARARVDYLFKMLGEVRHYRIVRV